MSLVVFKIPEFTHLSVYSKYTEGESNNCYLCSFAFIRG
jgi:hypothetical protein